MQLSELKRNNPYKKKKRIGRGGKRGKTSGKGHKGQKARAGAKMRPEMRDIIKRIPKLRGYKFKSIKQKPQLVNLDILNKVFSDGDFVSPQILFQKGVVKMKKGKMTKIKILSDGELKKKIVVSGCLFSANAAEKIKKAGGKIERMAGLINLRKVASQQQGRQPARHVIGKPMAGGKIKKTKNNFGT